jgi:protein TonB
MFIATLAFSAFTILPKKENVIMVKPYITEEVKLKKLENKPEETEKKKEIVKTEKPAAKSAPVNQVKHISNIKIVAVNEKADTVKTIAATDVIDIVNRVTTTPGIPAVLQPVKLPVNGGGDNNQTAIDRTSPVNGDAVDVLPAYPGGIEALREFLLKHLETPDELQRGETVSVRVKFVVDYTGKLTRFETLQNDVYNKEVLRVLKKMPDWVPGKTKGENVSVYYVMPVRFETSD